MSGDGDKNLEPDWLRNMPVRSEEIGFSPEQLIACRGCGKANPPTRSACVYCGKPFEGVGISRKLDLREPEAWEDGFNVVVVDASRADIERDSLRIASLIGAKRESVASILKTGKTVPLSRIDSESQAMAMADALVTFGIRTMIVPDASLQPALPLTRLRSITFEGDNLRVELFNTHETRSILRQQLALIVVGMIFDERTESVEKRKRRGAEMLHETAISSDEPVIDIYSQSDPAGWRIPARGFDFSCLGSEKTLIAAENMKSLITKLVEFSPTAELVDDYVKVRPVLEFSWPSEARRNPPVVAFGKKEVTNIFTTNNSMQFTKYSRFQWHLHEKKV